MADYLTIAREAEAVFREKMSRFISFAVPVSSASEAKERIAAYANEYHDARHVCWAYMIGSGRTEFLSSDNGEPSGTAGKPILGQINSLGLTNVLVVVVRYFGGIKLGTPGLIAAYRQAARLALDEGGTRPGRDMTQISFTFPYLAMDPVMRLIKALSADPDSGVSIKDQRLDNSCTITLELPLTLQPELTGRLSAISGVTFPDASVAP